MSDMVEGIGGAVEGALAGRAVEPERGENSEHDVVENACRNCGANAPGKFCGECGQKTHLHRTLSAIGHDLMHGVLHLDGKLWRTLPMLVFKPGQLTRRYIEGERASFVSPMAMFLFTVFAMFAVFQMVGISAPSDIGAETNVSQSTTVMREQVEKAILEGQAELERMSASDPERAEVEADLVQLEQSLAGIGEVEKLTFNTDGSSGLDPTGIDFIDQAAKKWQDNPSLMLYKLQANAYKFSWLLIPLSIPFMWLIFAWKRKFKAYDHAIFVTYSLAFMSLLFIVASLMGAASAPPAVIVFPLLIIPPLHIYKQLRGTYDLSRFAAIWRLLTISTFIWIVIGLFIQMLFLLGAL